MHLKLRPKCSEILEKLQLYFRIQGGAVSFYKQKLLLPKASEAKMRTSYLTKTEGIQRKPVPSLYMPVMILFNGK